jgi:putative transposase
LIWNQRHLLHALHEYETHYNSHRAHQALEQAAPLRAVPAPITDPRRITDLAIRRHDRLGGIIHGCLKTRTLYDEATAWSHHAQPHAA